MHTWYYRLNALFTVATTVLAVLCALASVTELLHTSDPVVSAQLVKIDGLSNDRGNDRAWLTLDIEADLRSTFNWNTKQAYVYVTVDFRTKRNQLNSITVFDRIIKGAAEAHVKESRAKVQWPFTLTDQGTSLRSKPFNVTVAWEKVPISGLLIKGERNFGGFQMPAEYLGSVRQQASHWTG